MPAVELARAAQQLADGPAMPQLGDVDRAPASEQRRHDDQQQEAHTEADRAERGPGLEVDELRDALDRAAERRRGGRPEDRCRPAAAGCPAGSRPSR